MSQDIDYTRYYRHWHDGSDSHHEEMAASWMPLLDRLMPSDRSAKIVDIGCGTGFVVSALLKLGFSNAIGFDSDKGQVAEAQRRELPVTQVPVSQTLEWLNSHANSFDVVTIFDVLEHIPVDKQLPFLRGVNAALKAGGTVVCQVPNSNSLVSSRYRWGDWTHHSSFTEHSIDFVLYNAGFDNIAVSETPDARPHFLTKSMIRWLMRQFFRSIRKAQFAAELGASNLSKAPFSPNLIAVARKGNLGG
jgi:SAM-dependent methyltransferase